VDRRWGRSFRGSRQFTRAAWRGLGWPERLVPTATWDGGERELEGEVDSVLKGGDGGAGELHGNKAKLLEGLVWIRKRRGIHGGAERRQRSSTAGVFWWLECRKAVKKWLGSFFK
jgi:hypothetical protein